MLWHFRLGRLHFQYLKQLLPKLFMNKNAFIFRCEVCELAKHHRTMIHNGVWGSSKMATFFGKR